uniref:SWIM-type domain-containing protein n=1 Tax=Lactuca sativa TaxID=4236 RepID=A0A9R1V621_LACSA|nr:hypothetical protein LSAT_V11C600306500 [Lactuca sativa]
MAESSRRMKSKESKATKKTKLRYVRDEEESDDDRLDLGLLDVEPDNFNPTSNLCDDPFLNILCDDKMLKNNQFEGDDEADVEDIHQEELEHEHLEDENGLEVGVEFRVHDPTVKWNQMKPTAGELYESPAQLRFALTNYVVANGYQLWFMKSDKSRIKSMVETHLCARNYNFGHLVSCNWLAKHYIKDIIRKPKMTLPGMMEDVLTKYSVKVSKGQCHRARVRAREMIKGKLEDHYAKIWDYANEILRSNPGSTCKVGVSVNLDGVNYFERFYVCFKALKDGWNTGCRRVIGLDGCFLKGQIKGEILIAIGRDANNHVYPIAWAVVNVENKENWTWFLQLLVDDLGVEDGRGLVVISDQHKGLLESVKAILPHVEHRQCARHIYANFRKRHTGLELKNLFWAAATSSPEGDFVSNMEKIKKITSNGYDWLMSNNPQSWCRAFFGQGYACEAVENGVSESFNSMIINIRKKPLLTMLEEIRIYVMARFYYLADKASTWRTESCPAIIEKMKEFGKEMRNWKVIATGGSVFETRYGYTAYKVDLEQHYCTCRLWEISGIPCVRGQAAINYTHMNPTDFLSIWFQKEKFMAAYTTNISPVNGSNLWAPTDYIKPLPPLTRRMPGRPKTKRRRHVSEVNDSKFPTVRARVCRTVRSSKCLQFRHNLKSCKNERVMKEYVPPRKPGRPRRGGNGITNKDGEGTSKQKAVKLVVKRKKKTKKAGEGSSNQDGQGGVETANDATVQEENGTVQETAPKIVNDVDAISDEIDVLLLQKCGYEPHEIEQAMERVDANEIEDHLLEDNRLEENLEMGVDANEIEDHFEADLEEDVNEIEDNLLEENLEMGVDANEIEDHLEANLEEDVNEIEDNLLEENLEMGVDVNEIVPPVQEVAIQGLDANSWVGEDDGNIDFIEDTQVVGRPRKRKISERIVKIKLKKAVYDKDGRGSSIKKPVNLE